MILSFSPQQKTGFEYSFIIKPGIDPTIIKFRFGGEIKKLETDKNGNLVVRSEIGGFVQEMPKAFYYDSKYDRVWVADNQKGIFGFLKGDSMQEYFRYSLSLAPNLAVIKRTNNMLVAFNENAFLRVDEVNKKFEQLYFFDKPCLRDVYIDEDSLAWLSTYGQGLYMYNL